MSVALQHAQIRAPGTDSFTVLVRHYTGYLMQVVKIMNGPGCEQLRQRYRAEGGMHPAPSQVFVLQIQQPQRCQGFGPNAAKLV